MAMLKFFQNSIMFRFYGGTRRRWVDIKVRVRLLITALTTVQVTNLYPKMVCCASSTAVPQMDSSCLPQLFLNSFCGLDGLFCCTIRRRIFRWARCMAKSLASSVVLNKFLVLLNCELVLTTSSGKPNFTNIFIIGCWWDRLQCCSEVSLVWPPDSNRSFPTTCHCDREIYHEDATTLFVADCGRR